MLEQLQQVEALVLDIEALKDNYAIPLQERNNQVQQGVEKVCKKLDQLLPSDITLSDIKLKTRIFYLKGKALNALPAYSKEAELLLAKVVKLQPALTDAWNCLGECFWKKGDLLTARDCFQGAVEQSKVGTQSTLVDAVSEN